MQAWIAHTHAQYCQGIIKQQQCIFVNTFFNFIFENISKEGGQFQSSYNSWQGPSPLIHLWERTLWGRAGSFRKMQGFLLSPSHSTQGKASAPQNSGISDIFNILSLFIQPWKHWVPHLQIVLGKVWHQVLCLCISLRHMSWFSQERFYSLFLLQH